ncbi:hypothetical protein F1654_10245 [Alkalicaulis satelles]|uniref:Secreted protein n=1 Tax=Alkalicaulis satelles TaxID=2609175 RepID=A0A5M6ZJ11_9PROT|nr:hypothetical protein [Alkalicaulis satelles]KAA5802211.1 hypothetical protein F1654_10245 [Alkalicaulis satelles]
MKHFMKAALAALLAAPAAASLVFAVPAGQAEAQSALGPEGRVYAIDTRQGRYTAQFRRGGVYQDSRPRTGHWQFDGRTLCVVFNAAGRSEPEYEICKPFHELSVGESYETNAWTRDNSPARITRVE